MPVVPENLGMHADKGNAGLDEASGDEQARAAQMPAVPVAHFSGLARQVEGVARAAGAQKREGPLLEFIEAVDDARLAHRLELLVELGDEQATAVEPIG